MRKLALPFALAVIAISLILGYLDNSTFGGTINFLTPSTAVATVVAFIALVLYEEGFGKIYVDFLEGSLLAAVALDATRLVSLATGVLVPKGLRLKLEWLGPVWVETKRVFLFATKPELIPPKAFNATSLALDPLPFLLVAYYFTIKRRK